MYEIVEIERREFTIVGDIDFQNEGRKQVAYVTMFDIEDNMFIAKYHAKNGEIIDNLSSPIDYEMMASADE